MIALLTKPGTPHSTTVEEISDVTPGGGEVLLRTLRVGVCGTDREIDEGLFGTCNSDAGPVGRGLAKGSSPPPGDRHTG